MTLVKGAGKDDVFFFYFAAIIASTSILSLSPCGILFTAPCPC